MALEGSRVSYYVLLSRRRLRLALAADIHVALQLARDGCWQHGPITVWQRPAGIRIAVAGRPLGAP
jgi:hypothetical protein